MNVCEPRHIPKYQVTYKSAKGGNYTPVWLVCENCIENKKCFGTKDQIEIMEILA